MRILFIDDDPMILRGLSRLAKSSGYEAVTTSTGYRALQMLVGDPSQFHVIVCDMELPDMTGVDIFNQAPEQCKPLFIFFTGAVEYARQALGSVPNRIFSKVESAELFKFLKEME